MKKRLRKSFPPKYSPLDKERAYRYYKTMWIAAHPEATQNEYEAAIKILSKLAGV